MFLYKIA